MILFRLQYMINLLFFNNLQENVFDYYLVTHGNLEFDYFTNSQTISIRNKSMLPPFPK
jgi:hypothetical protein